MSNPRVIYTPSPGATPESEAAILAAVYRFILDAAAKKKGGVPSTAGDGKELKDVPANAILPQR